MSGMPRVQGGDVRHILLVAHVGETWGHLVRGLRIADELAALGYQPSIAAGRSATPLLEGWHRSYQFRPLSWDWSHNSGDAECPSNAYVRKIIRSVRETLQLLERTRPAVVIGLPGVFTTQAARSLGIPHVSVVHAPYLTPAISLDRPTATEAAVLAFANRVAVGGSFDAILESLRRDLRLPDLTYREYLRTECFLIPHPELPLRARPNFFETNFIRASFGPAFDDPTVALRQCCYVTFGSGNPCDLTRIVELTRQLFSCVVVSKGNSPLSDALPGVHVRRFIASSSLAGRVAAVVSHGGIGTVGTFAEKRTPQLIVPTEIDQATMAVHATRAGIAGQCGLEEWAEAPRLGRRLPLFSDVRFLDALAEVRSAGGPSWNRPSSGASEAAAFIDKTFAPCPADSALSRTRSDEGAVSSG